MFLPRATWSHRPLSVSGTAGLSLAPSGILPGCCPGYSQEQPRALGARSISSSRHLQSKYLGHVFGQPRCVLVRACTSSVSITIEAPRPNDQAPKSDTTNPRSIPSNSGASLDWCAISCEPDVLAGDRAIDPLLSVRCRCRCCCCSFAAPRKHPHASTHRSSHHLSIDPSNHVLSLSLSLSLSLLLATDSSDRHPSLRRRGHVIDPLLPLRISILALSRSRSSALALAPFPARRSSLANYHVGRPHARAHQGLDGGGRWLVHHLQQRPLPDATQGPTQRHLPALSHAADLCEHRQPPIGDQQRRRERRACVTYCSETRHDRRSREAAAVDAVALAAAIAAAAGAAVIEPRAIPTPAAAACNVGPSNHTTATTNNIINNSASSG